MVSTARRQYLWALGRHRELSGYPRTLLDSGGHQGHQCITRQGTVSPPLRIRGIVLCTRRHGANGTRATQSDLSDQWGQRSNQLRRASTPTSIEAVLYHDNGLTGHHRQGTIARHGRLDGRRPKGFRQRSVRHVHLKSMSEQ